MCGRCRASCVVQCSTRDTSQSTLLTLDLPRGWRFVEPEALALMPPEILCPACVERLQLVDADSPADTAVMPALNSESEPPMNHLSNPLLAASIADFVRGLIRQAR